MSFHGILAIVGVAAFVLGCGIGVPLTYFAIHRSRERDAALDRVETVRGTVTTSTVERHRDPGSSRKYKYRPVVRFRYEYDGRTYESNRRAYDMLFGSTTQGRAGKTAGKYPEGETVSVYVDPEDPANGFLEVKDTTQALSTGFLTVIGVVTTLMGLAGGAVAVGVIALSVL